MTTINWLNNIRNNIFFKKLVEERQMHENIIACISSNRQTDYYIHNFSLPEEKCSMWEMPNNTSRKNSMVNNWFLNHKENKKINENT